MHAGDGSPEAWNGHLQYLWHADNLQGGYSCSSVEQGPYMVLSADKEEGENGVSPA